jgi:hypothetical protein
MKKCMQCGGSTKKKMAKGGSMAAGIPYASGAGQTDGKIGTMKKGGAVSKMTKTGFPDLNKDGKITKADILKGRGVIKKKGGSVKIKKK